MSHMMDRLVGRLTVAKEVALLKEQNRFLLAEVRKLNETLRSILSQNPTLQWSDENQTKQSFDFQWDQFAEGKKLTTDLDFMKGAAEQIIQITGLPAEWFPGKIVVDVGCGTGRFSHALLSLGASVTSVDQSEWACRRTGEICREFGDRSVVRRLNLLEWEETEDFDLAFSFGVVHHTGRTYRAIRNVAAKVKPGGYLFLMVYGFPTDIAGLRELNTYEDLRHELRPLSNEERKAKLLEKFGPDLAHGYFDAVSPKINDLLTFEELQEFLHGLGFTEVRRTVENRNHRITAQKITPSPGRLRS